MLMSELLYRNSYLFINGVARKLTCVYERRPPTKEHITLLDEDLKRIRQMRDFRILLGTLQTCSKQAVNFRFFSKNIFIKIIHKALT